jgi:hypothetical protein
MSNFVSLTAAAKVVPASTSTIRKDIRGGYIKSYHMTTEPISVQNTYIVDLDEVRAFYQDRLDNIAAVDESRAVASATKYPWYVLPGLIIIGMVAEALMFWYFNHG